MNGWQLLEDLEEKIIHHPLVFLGERRKERRRPKNGDDTFPPPFSLLFLAPDGGKGRERREWWITFQLPLHCGSTVRRRKRKLSHSERSGEKTSLRISSFYSSSTFEKKSSKESSTNQNFSLFSSTAHFLRSTWLVVEEMSCRGEITMVRSFISQDIPLKKIGPLVRSVFPLPAERRLGVFSLTLRWKVEIASWWTLFPLQLEKISWEREFTLRSDPWAGLIASSGSF